MPNPKTDRVDLKDPWIAAVLAYLIPGAGHFYQRRIFKGVIYSVCILGTFFCGVRMGEGRTVYMYYYQEFQEPNGNLKPLEEQAFPDLYERSNGLRKRNYGFLSQVLVGLPALPAVIQSRRYENEQNTPYNEIENGFDARFTGVLTGYRENDDRIAYPVKGRVSLKAEQKGDQAILGGTFEGTLQTKEGPKDIKLDVGPQELFRNDKSAIGYPVYASPNRSVMVGIKDVDEMNLTDCMLSGTVPRSFSNYYGVPPEDEVLQGMNRSLGKHWELAMVFTWIAGLLNILAIWDAHEGPAYGYGDEKPDDEEDAKKSDEAKAESSQEKSNGVPVAAVAAASVPTETEA